MHMASGALKGKSVVIIGGSTGLGFSAARAYVAAGARVVIVGRNAENVAQASKKLARNAVGMAGDAVNPDTATQAVALALQKFKGFHGLYHVAGGSGRKLG